MPNRRGFSLIEVLVAVALSTLLLGMALVNLWPARNSASSRSLAESLAEELRLAGRSAIASGVPVAVALPTQGSGPHCQSLYTLSGQQTPQMGRVRNYAQEFPGTYLCVGTWGRSGAGGWTRNQPHPMSNSDDFNPAAWINPVSGLDPTLIFTPAGTVTSNGLPLWNGEFYLVASTGVEFQSASVPGSGPALNYFSLQRLSKPWTVRVTASGSVTVLNGLAGSDGTTGLEDRSFATAAPPAPPLTTLPLNTAPTIATCQISPEPPDGSAAGETVVAPDEHISLRVTATDAQGDQLYCSWAASAGDFSSPVRQRMELEGAQWVSTWEWRPPVGVQTGSYTLTCTITDQRGAATTGGAQGSLAVTVQASPYIVFGDCSDGWIPKKIKRIRLSGAGETVLPKPEGEFWADLKVSPNGDKLVYTSFGSWLYSCNSDGTGPNWLSFDPVGPSYTFFLFGFLNGLPSFSPTGTQMVYPAYSAFPVDGPSIDLFICNTMGGGTSRFTNNDALTESHPMWSGDGQIIVYRSHDEDTGESEIRFKPVSGGPSVALTAAMPGNQTPVDLCPNLVGGMYRLFYRDLEQAQQFRVMDFDLAGTVTPVGVMNPSSGTFRGGAISTDGTKVTYREILDVYVANADGSGVLNLSNGPSGFYNDDPVFTPDGSQVVFLRMNLASPMAGDLYRARVDGSALARITRGNQVISKMSTLSGWDIVP